MDSLLVHCFYYKINNCVSTSLTVPKYASSISEHNERGTALQEAVIVQVHQLCQHSPALTLHVNPPIQHEALCLVNVSITPPLPITFLKPVVS
ncbi:hypothetical protein J6590_076164 [Homalodisca vitripennis]|nr:hypothetical protein J6590_076164 [Homalodisca vitripennis]